MLNDDEMVFGILTKHALLVGISNRHHERDRPVRLHQFDEAGQRVMPMSACIHALVECVDEQQRPLSACFTCGVERAEESFKAALVAKRRHDFGVGSASRERGAVDKDCWCLSAGRN
ncbi:hypothetical protein D7V77_14150 [Corallococcus sp. CA041A]|nr:hypothetical protein D7V77_14150 [Corallococcus sp. CA041A]